MTKLMVEIPESAVDKKLAAELRALRTKVARQEGRIKQLEAQEADRKDIIKRIKKVQDCIEENFPDYGNLDD